MVGKIIRYSIFLVCLAALLVSCGEPIGGPGKSPVFMSVQASDPYAVACDVYQPGEPGNVAMDTIFVNIKSIYRSPTPLGSPFADILLQEQRVRYFRSDGNPNVPAPFTITLQNNLLPQGGDLEIEIVVVRATAKLQSPLRELAFGGGEGEIYMTAYVEFFGEDLAGNAVKGDITIPIFARDW